MQDLGKQVDVLTSKNQALCKLKLPLINCYSMYCNNIYKGITNKSHELRLITKEHIATHTNLILLFKPALYPSTSVIKLFNSIKLKFLP